MGLIYLFYLTVGLPFGLEDISEQDVAYKRDHYEMIAEVNTKKERKYNKKLSKKQARQGNGKRRNIRREGRRGKDVKGYRRGIPTASKDRIGEQKEHRRHKIRERDERKAGRKNENG